jgi:hypothetical protein
MASMQIPISKGKDLFIEVDLDEIMGEDFSAEAYKEIVFQGLKQVLNRGMTGDKFESSKKVPESKREANNQALLEQAEANLEACRKGEIRVTGGKAKAKAGSNKALNTEAMRLSRIYVKDALKRENKKVSLVPTKEITAAAKDLLEQEGIGEEIWAEAEENLRERAKKEEKIASRINVSGIKEDQKLKAAAEAKKKPKAAGKPGVVVRARPPQHVGH